MLSFQDLCCTRCRICSPVSSSAWSTCFERWRKQAQNNQSHPPVFGAFRCPLNPKILHKKVESFLSSFFFTVNLMALMYSYVFVSVTSEDMTAESIRLLLYEIGGNSHLLCVHAARNVLSVYCLRARRRVCSSWLHVVSILVSAWCAGTDASIVCSRMHLTGHWYEVNKSVAHVSPCKKKKKKQHKCLWDFLFIILTQCFLISPTECT